MDKPQLFLLHYAGGNCYSYNFLTPFLKDFDVTPLELPGRGKRGKEKLLTDRSQAVWDIYNQIVSKLHSQNFLIFGHSLGANMAIRVCKMLEDNKYFPSIIVVSGNAGPGLLREKKRYLLDDNEIIEELISLGGASRDMLSDKELINFFLPILRADFEVSEADDEEFQFAVETPIFAIMGKNEEEVEKIQNWRRFTNTYFDYKLFDGGHFFILNDPYRLGRTIKSNYDKGTLLKNQRNA